MQTDEEPQITSDQIVDRLLGRDAQWGRETCEIASLLPSVWLALCQIGETTGLESIAIVDLTYSEANCGQLTYTVSCQQTGNQMRAVIPLDIAVNAADPQVILDYFYEIAGSSITIKRPPITEGNDEEYKRASNLLNSLTEMQTEHPDMYMDPYRMVEVDKLLRRGELFQITAGDLPQ